jgi:hypothetical protein
MRSLEISEECQNRTLGAACHTDPVSRYRAVSSSAVYSFFGRTAGTAARTRSIALPCASYQRPGAYITRPSNAKYVIGRA